MSSRVVSAKFFRLDPSKLLLNVRNYGYDQLLLPVADVISIGIGLEVIFC